MKAMLGVLVICCILVFDVFAQTPSNDCPEKCNAIVTQAKGTCYVLKDDNRSKEKITVGSCLLVGQRIVCEKRCRVRIKFCITEAERTIKGSYVVPSVVLAISDKGRGGRSMGAGAQSSPRTVLKGRRSNATRTHRRVKPRCMNGYWFPR